MQSLSCNIDSCPHVKVQCLVLIAIAVTLTLQGYSSALSYSLLGVKGYVLSGRVGAERI